MSASFADMLRAEALRARIDARHGAGCCAHLWLADDNNSDDHIGYCLQWAHEQTHGDHSDCIELLTIALRMSRTQRGKLAHGGYEGLDWRGHRLNDKSRPQQSS